MCLRRCRGTRSGGTTIAAMASISPPDLMPLRVGNGTGSRTGSLQPWVAMGAAKAAMESLVRYYAVALAKRNNTVNAISPSWTEDSVLNSLPETVQELLRKWHGSGWTPI